MAFLQLCDQSMWSGEVTAAQSCVVLPFQMPSTDRKQFVWCQTLAVVLPETLAVCLKSGVFLASIRGELGVAAVPPLEDLSFAEEMKEPFLGLCLPTAAELVGATVPLLGSQFWQLSMTTCSGFHLQPCSSETPS